MRMLRLIPILMLLGFIGLPVVPAFATCCSCTMGCARGCTCPGIGGCGTCAAEDFETVQSSSAATEATSDMTAVRKTMPSIATNSRMLDRLIRLGQTGQCALSKFALRLLADAPRTAKARPNVSERLCEPSSRCGLNHNGSTIAASGSTRCI